MLSKFQARVIRLTKGILGASSVKIEQNVKKLFPEYRKGNQHYDIVVPTYRLIIECHGEQHRTLTRFGNEEISTAVTNFVLQAKRDRDKEEIASLNGWNYVCVWQKELPGDDAKATAILKAKILSAITERSGS